MHVTLSVDRNRWLGLPLFFLLLVCMLALALVRPYTHDEGQYVAATALALHGLPYRDFAYLQTPLQPLLFAPLALAFPGWLFLSLRLVNALLICAAAGLIQVALARAEVAKRYAVAMVVLFVACDATMYAAGVARNDALPTALFAAALAMLAGRPTPAQVAGAAFALASASAAKISFAIPTAALLLMAIFGPSTVRMRLPLCPILIGILPMVALVLLLAAGAPRAFFFEVISYPVQAPIEWYSAIGRGWKTGWWHNIDFTMALARGPALLALVTIALAIWRLHRMRLRPDGRQLIFGGLLLAGLIAAYLPNPSYPQYLLPLLPPLFVCLGLAFNRWQTSLPRLIPIWACAIAFGLAPSIQAAAFAVRDRSLVVIDIERDAHRIGMELDEASIHGPMAGLSPVFFADSGRPIDRDFAAGPFLFRMGSVTTAAEDLAWHFVTRHRVDRFTSGHPTVVLTGREEKSRRGINLDKALASAALKDGFEPVFKIDRMQIWLRRGNAERWDTVNPNERAAHDSWEAKWLDGPCDPLCPDPRHGVAALRPKQIS